MSKIVAIGEALIDFIPGESGKAIKQVDTFTPKVGGAPANVCGVFARLGQQSQMITQLGQDPFGDKIVEEFMKFGIGCDYIQRTNQANTSLAFVALKEDGNREFSFYRKPGADMLLQPDRIQKKWFGDVDVLHFCSVSLGNFPMKQAHEKAIEYALEEDCFVSFDPNLRLALWEDEKELYQAVQEFLPKAHILKISDEELEFITGCKTIDEAREVLFQGNVKLVIYTKGSEGAEAFTRNAKGSSPGKKVKAVDTTGAGDAFIGSFLYQLTRDGVGKEDLESLSKEKLEEYLDYSNEYCARSVVKQGAIASYPREF